MKIRLYSAGVFLYEYAIDDYLVGAEGTVQFWYGSEHYEWSGHFLVSGGTRR